MKGIFDYLADWRPLFGGYGKQQLGHYTLEAVGDGTNDRDYKGAPSILHVSEE